MEKIILFVFFLLIILLFFAKEIFKLYLYLLVKKDYIIKGKIIDLKEEKEVVIVPHLYDENQINSGTIIFNVYYVLIKNKSRNYIEKIRINRKLFLFFKKDQKVVLECKKFDWENVYEHKKNWFLLKN